MTVTAGGRGLANGTSLHVFNGGTFTTNDYFDVGASVDAGNGPTGTLSVSGAGSVFQQTGGFNSLWGTNSGDHANVLISDGGRATLSSGVAIANNHGSAEVNVQTGGTLHVGGSIFQAGVLSAAASKPGGDGPRIGATGGGGQLNGTSGGFANINISGGTLSTGSTTSAVFGLGATVNLTSGKMDLGGDTTFSSGSSLNWSGGTMTFADARTFAFDGGVGSITTGPWILSNGSTLRITNGGSLTATTPTAVGTTFTAPNTTGTLTVDGANSRITVNVPSPSLSDWGFRPGDAATVNFSNSGVGSYSHVRVGGNGARGP